MVPPGTRISCSATAATSSKGPSAAVRERIDSRASSGVDSSTGLRLSAARASAIFWACGSRSIVMFLPVSPVDDDAAFHLSVSEQVERFVDLNERHAAADQLT